MVFHIRCSFLECFWKDFFFLFDRKGVGNAGSLFQEKVEVEHFPSGFLKSRWGKKG